MMNLFGDESKPPETAETLEGLMGIEEGNDLLEGGGDETSDAWRISVAVTGEFLFVLHEIALETKRVQFQSVK